MFAIILNFAILQVWLVEPTYFQLSSTKRVLGGCINLDAYFIEAHL